MTTIDPTEVHALVRTCLYSRDEVLDGVTPTGAIFVEGIMTKFGFHPERLEHHRSQVQEWLALLPHTFRESEGGGWSFLNACHLENRTQWTGEHSHMEELFCLGMGLGLVKCLLPREVWPSLPGGMPYYSIIVEEVMKCPVCEGTDIEHCPSEGDTIKYCNSCKFQWSTELPLPLLASMAVRYNQERRMA